LRISLKSLHYLNTAIELQSIKKASDKLHVVPSAISSAIDLIEQEMELKLITRYPSRGIQPTETGKVLFKKINVLLDNYHSLISEGAEVKNSISGTLRLALGVAAAAAFIPTLIQPLIDKNSDITLKLFETDNDQAQYGLLNGDFDAIIFLSENVKPGFTCESLMKAPPYILAPKDYFPRSQKTVSLSHFNELPMVLLNLPGVSEYYNSLFEVNKIRPKVVATAKTNQMVRSLVGAGLGCSLLNLKGAADTTAAGDEVRILKLEGGLKPMELKLGFNEEYQRKLVKAFIIECRNYFRSSTALKFLVS
jgi:DNA-binding transcriptional LysR family regulator